MRINNNIMAMNTYRQLGLGNAAGARSMEKLSSGFRINRAGDDAAGLAISEKMRGQIRGLNMASRNGQDGISMLQTAEGALNETQAILQRMRELAVQSATDTNVEKDRTAIQNEIDQLATEITRIANTTEFNTQNLLNGGLSKDTFNGKDITFHIGANSLQSLSFGIKAMDAFSLGVAGSSTDVVVTGTGPVASASVTGTAAAVVDGNAVTASIAEVAGSAAQAAEIVGGSHTVTTDLTLKDASITITVDGTDYKINDLFGWDGSGDQAALISLLEGADTVGDGSGTKLSTVAGITGDGSALTIKANSTGASSSVSVSYTGVDAADAATLFGIDDSTSATGADATATTYTLTLSDGTRTDSVITGLAADAATAIGTGDFAGFTVNFSSALTDGVSNTLTLAVITGSAASIAADGTVTDAVTNAGIDVSTRIAADTAITKINDAINSVSEERSKLGALQNRLEHTIKNLDTSAENLQAAESRIRDVDMAKEMMEFTKNSILQQAATAMLAQANQAPQGVLQLLR